MCKTSDRVGLPTFKEQLLSVCDQRNDSWAMEVRVRLNDVRASHDLHAADGRYHEKCRKLFSNKRNVSSASLGDKVIDEYFDRLARVFMMMN